jgi:biotin carboxyl carrier protein
MADENERSLAAAVGSGGAGTAWARHAREDLQVSHTLNSPLARWTSELIEAPPVDATRDSREPVVEIPATVLQPRRPHRLPEDAVCRSPIAGMVTTILIQPGQPVARRQPILVIEAMKMQNEVNAKIDGILQAMHVSPGDAVKAGQILFELA